MFSYLFTRVKVFYITCEHSCMMSLAHRNWQAYGSFYASLVGIFFLSKVRRAFYVFHVLVILKKMKVLWIRKSSKRRVHFLNQFKYPLKLSHTSSGLSGWENKGKHRGVFGQAVSATMIKDSHIPAIAKEPPSPLRRLARNPWQHGRHARASMTNLVPG